MRRFAKALSFALALVLAMGAAQSAPEVVLHILKNGHVRFGSGPELDLVQFKAELRDRVARKEISEMPLDLAEKPDFSKVAAVLAEIQNSGVKIGFMVGKSQQ